MEKSFPVPEVNNRGLETGSILSLLVEEMVTDLTECE